jgi:hypothetical protein
MGIIDLLVFSLEFGCPLGIVGCRGNSLFGHIKVSFLAIPILVMVGMEENAALNRYEELIERKRIKALRI